MRAKAYATTAGLLILTACNVSAPTPAPVPPPSGGALVSPIPTLLLDTDTPTPTPTRTPTETLVPTETLTPTITPTFVPPIITTMEKDVNCRFGPATEFAREGALMLGESSTVHGRNEAGTWWYIANPDAEGGFCWVSAKVTVIDGDTAPLPVIPTPAAQVTLLSVQMTPDPVKSKGCVFPVTFTVKFRFYVNGPATVTFHRTRSDAYVGPAETATFLQSGEKLYTDYYRVSFAGAHWYRVEVTAPNEIKSTAKARAICV